MPKVTVVVPAYNAAAFVGEALDSVAAQTFTDFEVVVVDDGSTDGTAEIAAARPGVRVLRRARGGPAAARNDGVSAGSGSLLAWLDADDLWLPDKLERQVALLDARPDLVLVHAPAETQKGDRFIFRPKSKNRSVPAGLDPAGLDLAAQLVADNFVTTSAAVVRRDAFERAGGFDTDPRLVSVEDYDLWLRLSLLGPFATVPQVLVRRRLHETSLSADPLRLYRRALRVIEKFEVLPESEPLAGPVRRRKAELCYLIGRGLLSRGARRDGRRMLRRSRSHAPTRAAACLALETLSLLPRSWLLGLHELRERRRQASRATPLPPP